MINGRGYPDTVNPDGSADAAGSGYGGKQKPDNQSQKISSLVT